MMKCRDKRIENAKEGRNWRKIFLVDEEEKRHKKSLENETKCDVNIH